MKSKINLCLNSQTNKSFYTEFYEHSFGYDILNFYSQIDSDIKSNPLRANPCKKGCSNCCKQFFMISPMEFYTILKILKDDYGYKHVKSVLEKGYRQFKKLEITQPKLAKILATGITTKDLDSQTEFAKSLSLMESANELTDELDDFCIFLDKKSNSCSIYEYRPMVCRCHGVGFLDKSLIGLPCVKAKEETFSPQYLLDFSYVNDKMLSLTAIQSAKYETLCIDRPLPILYFCKFLYETNDNFIKNKINSAENLSIEEYINIKIDKILAKNR